MHVEEINHVEDNNHHLPHTNVKKTSNKRKKIKTIKNSVYVIGDSMLLRSIDGYELKRESKSKDSVFVKCFPGATIEVMHSYSWPSMKKNPSRIVLHCGTNDLQSSDSADDIAKQLMTIACNLKSESNEVIVSGIIPRCDEWNEKAMMVDNVVRNYCLNKDIGFIDHNNINVHGHLNKGGLHLKREGSKVFFNNLLETVTY